MTQERRADAILTADWHLREDQPTCRTDDFEKAQWKKVDFIADLQAAHDCPVILSGDLFNHWKPSPSLISKTIKHLPNKLSSIFGNHDLPQHNLDLAHKSGMWTLYEAGKLRLLGGTHWGQTPFTDRQPVIIKGHKILVWHVMTYLARVPYPGCSDPKAHVLLNKYSEYDLILTGHNHIPFISGIDGRILVNPGSLSRQAADQIDFNPRVYLWYAESNTVEAVYLPIENNVVSREHIDARDARDERIDAFVSQLNTNWSAVVGFEENLERFIQENTIEDEIKNIIYKAITHE